VRGRHVTGSVPAQSRAEKQIRIEKTTMNVIPMKSRGRFLRVFISSTSQDLHDYRGVARNVILKMGWFPEMMENFTADTNPTVEACRQKIKNCDLLLLIVAFKQGWVPGVEEGGNGVDSITALELAYARKQNISVLVMVADADWPQSFTEEEEAARQWVKTFRGKVNQIAEFFSFEKPDGPTSDLLPAFRARVSEVLVAHRERLLAQETGPGSIYECVDYYENAFDKIRDGRGIPFLGPGVYGDGPLSNQALILALRQEVTQEPEPCLATAAEFRERYLKRRGELLLRLSRIIHEQSAQAKANMPKVYDMIAETPAPPLIVSATYDQLLVRHLERSGRSVVVVTHIVYSRDGEHDGKILLFHRQRDPEICLADRLDLSDAGLVIYNPLGSPLLNERLDPDLGIDTVVITECDHLTFLGRLQNQHTQIPTRFNRLFQRWALLFIGYSLDVWHYRLVMQVFQSIGGRCKDSLTLAVRAPSTTMERLTWQRLGADLIALEPNAFAERVQSDLAKERIYA
jgi:hypothetical protein